MLYIIFTIALSYIITKLISITNLAYYYIVLLIFIVIYIDNKALITLAILFMCSFTTYVLIKYIDKSTLIYTTITLYFLSIYIYYYIQDSIAGLLVFTTIISIIIVIIKLVVVRNK